MDNNRVSVKIYGQEYIIAGEKPREQIVRVAAYVDNKMHEISSAVNAGPESCLAVLSAVNISDEYFDLLDRNEELEKQNAQLQKDTQHYVQLWDEAKKNYIQYKAESQVVVQQKEELQKKLSEKDREMQKMQNTVDAAEEEAEKRAAMKVTELEEKCKELETSFFDIQMENIQLKKALEKQRRNNE